MLKIGFIGAGAVAATMAVELSKCGYPVVAISSPGGTSATRISAGLHGCSAGRSNQAVADIAEMVFIATPDAAISSVCRDVQWHSGQYVVHLSGGSTAEKLKPARQYGALTGVMHPLQTFTRGVSTSLEGVTFAIEADNVLLAILQNMVTALGGHWLAVKPEDRVLYHAAAVMAGNYLTTLAKLAADLWAKFGVSPEDSIKALLPLIKGAVKNLESPGLPGCLTGPIARGDCQTIKDHLDALRMRAPEIETTYRELGLQTLPIALAKGKLDATGAAQLQLLLTGKR
jgi:predicted short-subunit dehydrogenase-like oxidoreductase (DUF2520 family)